MFSSIESNAFLTTTRCSWTKGTLIMSREQDAPIRGGAPRPANERERLEPIDGRGNDAADVGPGGPVLRNHERQHEPGGGGGDPDGRRPANVRVRGSRIMIQRFCSAVRVGTPLSCGADQAFDSARACIRANEAIKQKARLTI